MEIIFPLVCACFSSIVVLYLSLYHNDICVCVWCATFPLCNSSISIRYVVFGMYIITSAKLKLCFQIYWRRNEWNGCFCYSNVDCHFNKEEMLHSFPFGLFIIIFCLLHTCGRNMNQKLCLFALTIFLTHFDPAFFLFCFLPPFMNITISSFTAAYPIECRNLVSGFTAICTHSLIIDE